MIRLLFLLPASLVRGLEGGEIGHAVEDVMDSRKNRHGGGEPEQPGSHLGRHDAGEGPEDIGNGGDLQKGGLLPPTGGKRIDLALDEIKNRSADDDYNFL